MAKLVHPAGVSVDSPAAEQPAVPAAEASPAEAWAAIKPAGAYFGLPALPVAGEIRAAGSGFDRQLKPEQQDQARRLFGVVVEWAAEWGVYLPI